MINKAIFGKKKRYYSKTALGIMIGISVLYGCSSNGNGNSALESSSGQEDIAEEQGSITEEQTAIEDGQTDIDLEQSDETSDPIQTSEETQN